MKSKRKDVDLICFVFFYNLLADELRRRGGDDVVRSEAMYLLSRADLLGLEIKALAGTESYVMEKYDMIPFLLMTWLMQQ